MIPLRLQPTRFPLRLFFLLFFLLICSCFLLARLHGGEAEKAEEKKADPYALGTSEQKTAWEAMAKTPQGLFFSGRYSQALEALKDAKTPEAIALKADILVETGKDREAVKLLTEAIEAEGEAPPPVLLAARGDAHQVVGDYDKAEKDYLAAVADLADKPKPGQMRAKLALGELYHLLARRNDWLDAADWFFDYYDPNKVDEYGAADVYYVGAGAVVGEDFKNGFAVMASAQKKDKTFLPAYVRLGQIYAEKYEYPNAAREFKDALKLNPHHPDAHVGLAGTFMRERNFTEAEEHVRAALETNPRHVPAMVLLAAMDFLDERDTDALAHIDKALAINPRQPEVLQFQAAIVYLLGDEARFAAIQETLNQVYSLLPFDNDEEQALVRKAGLSRLYVSISEALVPRRSEELALPWARKAVEADPENAAALSRLGLSLMRQGLEEEAAPVLAQAFRLDPFNVWVYNLRQLLQEDKKYEKLKTARFQLRLFEKDAPILRPYIEDMVEAQLTHCEKLFGYRVPKSVRLSIMRTQAHFAARVTGLPTLHAAGATTGPFVALVSPAAFKAMGHPHNWESTMLHEIAHVVTLMGSKYRIPRWLTEGMSVYTQGNTRSIRDVPFKAMVEHGPLPDLATWNRDFTRPEYGWRVPAAYEAAGLFVGWMVEAHGKEVLPKLVKLYGEGKTTAEVFQAAVGKDLASMNKWFHARLRAYADTVQCQVMENPAKLKEYEKTYASNPDDMLVCLKLLRIYMAHNDKKAWTLADQLVKRAQKLDKEGGLGAGDKAYAVAGVIAGGAALREGKLDQARRLCDLTLRIDPGNAHAEFLLGLVEVRNGNPALAEQRFRAVIRLFPRFVMNTTFSNPYRALVKLLLDRKDKAGAAQILKQYCSIAANDPEALRRLAKLYEETDQNAKAMSVYRRIVGIDPYMAKDHEAFAALLEKANMPEKAKRERDVAAACIKRAPKEASEAKPKDEPDDKTEDGPAKEPAKKPDVKPKDKPDDKSKVKPAEKPKMDPELEKFLKGL